VVEREFEFGESHCRIAAGGGEKADILSFRGALPRTAGQSHEHHVNPSN
jgi:hypothetical protein